MRRFFGKLYVQCSSAFSPESHLGYSYPSLGVDMKPLGDVFIKLIKMVFAPDHLRDGRAGHRPHGEHEGARPASALAP